MKTEFEEFEGKLFPATVKRSPVTVFFVHFYDGSRLALQRHVAFVNELGYDAFAFNLRTPSMSLLHPPIALEGRFGLKHLYADQVELLLNRLPGKKLIYAFSNPAAAAIEAMARRKCSDVVGLVCDSGPTAKFVKSVYNLYSRGESAKSLPSRLITVPFFAMMWSPHVHHDLQPQLETFPKNFPILSIRGWKDPLIAPADIDAVFEGHPRLDWRKLSLPDAAHLNGLRDFADEYVPPVRDFMKEVLPRS